MILTAKNRSDLYFIRFLLIWAFVFFSAVSSLAIDSIVSLNLSRLEKSTTLSKKNSRCLGVDADSANSSSCPKIINSLVNDDESSRWGVQSYAQACRKASSSQPLPINWQQILNKHSKSSLSDYQQSVLSLCYSGTSDQQKAGQKLSKMIYYSERLQRGQLRILSDRIQIGKVLGLKVDETCPSAEISSGAQSFCQEMKSCAEPVPKISELAKDLEENESLFLAAQKDLKDLPKDCDSNRECLQAKKSLQNVLVSLQKSYPWLADEEFQKGKINNRPGPFLQKYQESRLRAYFKKTYEDLGRLKDKINQSMECIYAAQDKCEIDDLRKTLNLMPELPSEYFETRRASAWSTFAERISEQRCVEDASFDKMSTGNIMGSFYKDAGLAAATLGLGAVANLPKLLQAGRGLRGVAAAAEGGNLGIEIWNATEQFAQAKNECQLPPSVEDLQEASQILSARGKSLQSDKMKLSDSKRLICQSGRFNLNSKEQAHSQCLLNSGFAGVAALVTVPGAKRFLGKVSELFSANDSQAKSASKLLQSTSNETKLNLTKDGPDIKANSEELDTIKANTETSPSSSHTGNANEGKPKGQQRQADQKLTKDPNDRRWNDHPRVIGEPKLKNKQVYESPSIAKMPVGMRVIEGQNIEGKTQYLFQKAERMSDGTVLRDSLEIQFVRLKDYGEKNLVPGFLQSGRSIEVLDATNPNGRAAFESIMKANAGKGAVGFFDVMNLGAINKFADKEAGDKLLSSIAKTIYKYGEGKVTLARTGGDEFGFILHEPNPEKAKAIMEKIRDAIRRDKDEAFGGEGKQVFRDEKILRANAYKQNPTLENREAIEELAKVQNPDVSIGSALIGQEDNLDDLMIKAEKQASQMKAETALAFGRSAKKYGVNDAPSDRPDPRFKADIASPAMSSSYRVSKEASPVNLDLLPAMTAQKVKEIRRFGDTTVSKFQDQSGKVTYRIERYYDDLASGTRQPVSYEVPTKGRTGLWDADHPESQRLIADHLNSNSDNMLVMTKLKNLKYLNYLPEGTKEGDRVLEAVAKVIRRNMRENDLTFKGGGADFYWSIDHSNPTDLKAFQKRINQEIEHDPELRSSMEGLRQVIQSTKNDLNSQRLEAIKAGNKGYAKELQKKIEELNSFTPNIQVQAVKANDVQGTRDFLSIRKRLEERF